MHGTVVAGADRARRRQAMLWLVAGNTLWAGTYAAGKRALDDLSFVELNAVRFTLATLLLTPVLWAGRAMLGRELADAASRRTLMRLVLLGFVLNKGFEYAGLAMSTAVDVALLIASESIFTAVLSWMTLGERLSAVRVTALAVGLAGAYLVVARGLVPDLSEPASALRIGGDLLVVVALVCEAAYTVGGKASLGRMPPLLLVGVSVAGSLVVWIPAAALTIARSGIPAITPPAWLSIIYMSAFATVAAYWAWFRGLSALDASAAAPFLFIQPLLGAALGVVLLGEALGWATVTGAVLILASLGLIVLDRDHPRDAALALAEPPP